MRNLHINVDVTPWKCLSVIPPNHPANRRPGIEFHLSFLNKWFSSSGLQFAALEIRSPITGLSWRSSEIVLGQPFLRCAIHDRPLEVVLNIALGFHWHTGVLIGMQGLKNLFFFFFFGYCRQTEWRGDSISHPERQGEKEKATAHDTDKRSEKTDA